MVSPQEDGSRWESIRMLIAAMVGRQALVAAALRKISTHAYGSLIARRPCLLNQVCICNIKVANCLMNPLCFSSFWVKC